MAKERPLNLQILTGLPGGTPLVRDYLSGEPHAAGSMEGVSWTRPPIGTKPGRWTSGSIGTPGPEPSPCSSLFPRRLGPRSTGLWRRVGISSPRANNPAFSPAHFTACTRPSRPSGFQKPSSPSWNDPSSPSSGSPRRTTTGTRPTTLTCWMWKTNSRPFGFLPREAPRDVLSTRIPLLDGVEEAVESLRGGPSRDRLQPTPLRADSRTAYAPGRTLPQGFLAVMQDLLKELTHRFRRLRPTRAEGGLRCRFSFESWRRRESTRSSFPGPLPTWSWRGTTSRSRFWKAASTSFSKDLRDEIGLYREGNGLRLNRAGTRMELEEVRAVALNRIPHFSAPMSFFGLWWRAASSRR